jgi:hypothetical protein
MEWIVHIGTEKTGSKAIQGFLAHEPHRIAGRTFCFPKSGRVGGWHRPIHHGLFNGQTHLLEAAIQEGMESSADLGILSYEGLYSLTEPQIELLHKSLGTARILLFIRRQDQLTNSRYNQLFKSHLRSYQDIVEFESSMLDYRADFDHMKTLQKWGAVFGMGNLLPIIYDKSKNAIEQFLDSVGLSADFDNYQFRNPNPAIDPEGLSILRAVKQQNTDPSALPNLIDAAHSILARHFVDTYAMGEEQYLFSLSEREAIYCHYVDSNEQLRQLFFSDRDCLFSTLEPGRACRTDLPADQAVVRTIFKKVRLQTQSSLAIKGFRWVRKYGARAKSIFLDLSRL